MEVNAANSFWWFWLAVLHFDFLSKKVFNKMQLLTLFAKDLSALSL